MRIILAGPGIVGGAGESNDTQTFFFCGGQGACSGAEYEYAVHEDCF